MSIAWLVIPAKSSLSQVAKWYFKYNPKVSLSIFYILRHIDIFVTKSLVKKASVRYDICGKNNPALFCYTDCSAQCLPYK